MRRKIVSALAVMLCLICAILPGCKKKESTAITIPETEAYINSFEYEPVTLEPYGYVGKIPMYLHELICCYSAIVDDYLETQPDYDAGMSVEERVAYRDKVLTHAVKESLKQKALSQHSKLTTMYIRSQHKEKTINQSRMDAIASQWKQYGVQYYNSLKDIYPDIESPDDAMRFMTGCSVMEAVAYMQVQASASNMASSEFYDMKCTNKDIEQYYKDHVNDFRRVEIRAVYFTEKTTADQVIELMKKRPQDIDNLAKAYNENLALAKTNGLVSVNSSCTIVPEEVKAWAYVQTEETLFEKHGKIELIEAGEGWYAVMCNSISEYSDVEGNEIYKEVAQAYKGSLLEVHIAALLAKEDFAINNVDYVKANAALDGVF